VKSTQPVCIYKWKLSSQVYLQRSKMFKHVCLIQRLVAWLHHSSQLIERLALAQWTCFLFEFTMDHSCVYITHAEGTYQASNSLGNKIIEPIRYQLNASEYFFVSSHLQILKSTQDNMLFEQSFWKDHWAFCNFEFSRSQLINVHEKNWGQRKSLDNRIVRIIEVRLYLK